MLIIDPKTKFLDSTDNFRFGGNDREGKSHLYRMEEFQTWCKATTNPVLLCRSTRFRPSWMGTSQFEDLDPLCAMCLRVYKERTP